MDFSFTAVIPRAKDARGIYSGSKARVLVHNRGPGDAAISHGKTEQHAVMPGSAILIEAETVTAGSVKDDGCVLDVRVEFDGRPSAK